MFIRSWNTFSSYYCTFLYFSIILHAARTNAHVNNTNIRTFISCLYDALYCLYPYGIIYTWVKARYTIYLYIFRAFLSLLSVWISMCSRGGAAHCHLNRKSGKIQSNSIFRFLFVVIIKQYNITTILIRDIGTAHGQCKHTRWPNWTNVYAALVIIVIVWIFVFMRTARKTMWCIWGLWVCLVFCSRVCGRIRSA